MFTRRFAAFIALVMAAMPIVPAQVPSTSLVLDRRSFRETKNLNALQGLGDRVATLVDNLIPGTPRLHAAPILVFDGSDAFQRENGIKGPITLVGPKLPGEPASTAGGTIRIALSGIQGVYFQRFVFQLAHELAHVKMGVQVDNALIETLATAVSFEVLRRMDLYDYLYPLIQTDIRSLPPAAQQQLADGNYGGLRAFWQGSCASHWSTLEDRPCQTLGALLLQEGHEPRWAALLDISGYVLRDGAALQLPLAVAAPDVDTLKRLGLRLDALGYN